MTESTTPNVVLTSEQIAGLLPHRYPFALVDRVIAHEPGVSATAIKNVTMNEPQFQGHFPERPLMPGVLIVEAIASAGLVPAATPRPAAPRLEQPLLRTRGNSVITATPSDRFGVVGIIDFPQAAIGRQQFALELTPQRFVDEIAPARTFGFRDQVEQLRAAGLIQGGALDNALVCDGDQWMNPPLRFEDEPVRHKLLDLIGDLALVGFPEAQVLVYKGSHGLHTDLAAAL